MKPAPTTCILCKIEGKPEVWNGLDILTCPQCSLSWRASFDLPLDYYSTIAVDAEEGKKKKREANCSSQIRFLKRFLPTSGIYDLGSGDGTFLQALRNKGYTQCVGIEPGIYGLNISKERGLDVVQGEIADLPKYTQRTKARAVTMFHLLEHLENPKESLQVIRGCVEESGILVMETPDSQAPMQYLTNRKNYLVYPEHLFYWNEMSITKLLESTGFDVVHIAKRSFDWQNTSISNSLFRLGLKKYTGKVEKKNNDVRQEGVSDRSEVKSNVFRVWLRKLLAYTVHLLGRDDYVIVVAKLRGKPSL